MSLLNDLRAAALAADRALDDEPGEEHDLALTELIVRLDPELVIRLVDVALAATREADVGAKLEEALDALHDTLRHRS